MVHGDDFTFAGKDDHLKWAAESMSSWYQVKVKGVLGPEKDDVDEIEILGRRVRWTPGGIELRADARHAKDIVEKMGLTIESKSAQIHGKKTRRRRRPRNWTLARRRCSAAWQRRSTTLAWIDLISRTRQNRCVAAWANRVWAIGSC